MLFKRLALERHAPHDVLFYYIYVELRSNEENSDICGCRDLRSRRLRGLPLKNPVNAPQSKQNAPPPRGRIYRFVNLRNHKRSVGFARGHSSGRGPVP